MTATRTLGGLNDDPGDDELVTVDLTRGACTGEEDLDQVGHSAEAAGNGDEERIPDVTV